MIGKEGGFLGNFKETNQQNFNHGTVVHVEFRILKTEEEGVSGHYSFLEKDIRFSI